MILPKGAEILSVGQQGRYDTISIWYSFEQDTVDVEVIDTIIVGTGGKIQEGYKFIGTVINNSDGFVWHVFVMDSFTRLS